MEMAARQTTNHITVSHCLAQGHSYIFWPPSSGNGPVGATPAIRTFRDMKPSSVARALGRDLSCVCRLFKQKKAPKPSGRPVQFTDAMAERTIEVLEEMITKADANQEVTLQMVMRRCRIKVCEKVVAKALHKRGYWFRRLRSKMILTPEDVKVRYVWSKKYKGKSKRWWRKAVHIHLDNHCFKVATTGFARKLLAKRRVRGVYRKKGKSLRSAHVKPDPKLRLNTGAKGILKMAGLGAGKVLVFETIHGTWSGQKAADMYKDVVKKALKKQYPGKQTHCILEDNDPTGNFSKKGIEAKTAQKLYVLKLPKRSPDLNVCDYTFWSEVEKRMRAQERKMPALKRETREAFEKRLDKTARELPAAYINKSIESMRKRCRLLCDAEGGLF